MRRRDESGVGIVGALFVTVVLAGVAAMMLNLGGAQRQTVSFAILQARANHAARSGIEWGIYQTMQSSTCPASTTLTLTEGGTNGFSVAMTCTSTTHKEGATTSKSFHIVAVAEVGTYGNQDYVKRRMQATVTDAS